ncbi:MAG: DUF1295 domain-containing protein [Myxococcales bacterium]|nr:DUF1295 domain-containing protein [Myxococcales bacterium]MCB9732209.1 DUF1295 domain-containing protein [Deltaproteobacteria bacterium]
MSAGSFYEIGLWVMAGLTLVTVGALTFIVAPYGRHRRDGFGPGLPARVAWMVFESPAVLLMAAVALARGLDSAGAVALFALWNLHYVNRTIVWPLRARTGGKTVPLAVVASAFCFQLLNSSLNALAISGAGAVPDGWLLDPRFVVGAALFLAGYAVNLHADAVLRGLRAPGETGYKVPRGGLYERVSCPNYLGEILEWCGWALASWSLAGLAFALYTAANLAPRALAHHRWYRERFPDYPPERKALLPWLW